MKANALDQISDSGQLDALQSYTGRVAVQQRVLPQYRGGFFDTLTQACTGGLSVFAGQPGTGEGIETAGELHQAHYQRTRNVHIRQVSSPRYLCWQRGILDWLKSWQPDILIVEANPRYISTPRGISWMHHRQRPVIGWGLGVPPVGASRGSYWQRLRSARRLGFYRLFDGIIAYSQKGAGKYIEAGFPPERVYIAPNAVAFRPTSSPPPRPNETKERLNILFVGRLQARKRIDNLLLACSALPENLQPGLFIVGDGPEKANLEELAATNYPRAIFLGARHGAELEPLYTAADLFVLPGTGGLAVQQAMAHALPVIVAEGDGTQDDLVRPESGWRIPAGDLQALTATLKDALSSPRLRRMGEEAYRIVAEEVNVERMVGAFVTALNSVRIR
jgi:glycosyltransferase involved in cell wall biosynthesis